MSDLIGTKIQRYHVESLLGEGGMGRVYQIFDADSDTLMALKLLHAHLVLEDAVLTQFTQEIEAMKRLNHPHIAPLYGSGIWKGRPYFATELLDGIDLRGRMRQLQAHGQLMKLADVVAIGTQVAHALDHMKQLQVVHRDVKPENLFLRRSDEGEIDTVLIDFGLALLMDDLPVDENWAFQGSAPYMSPETITGQRPDSRSDLYALGVVLYELLSGRQPFSGATSNELFQQHQQMAPPSIRTINPAVPADLDTLVLRMLAKDPNDRFQSGAELARAIQQFDQTAVSFPTSGLKNQSYGAASTTGVATQLEMPEYLATVRIPDKIDLNQTWYGGQFRLVIGHDTEPAVTHSLHKPVLTIGRAPDNDIVLNDYRISRHHARLEKVTSQDSAGRYSTRWQLIDAKSINGVYDSHGERLEPGEIHGWEPNTPWRMGPYFLQWDQLFDQAKHIHSQPYNVAPPQSFSPPRGGDNGRNGTSGAAMGAATAVSAASLAQSNNQPRPAGQPSFTVQDDSGFVVELESDRVRLSRGEPQEVGVLVRNGSATVDDLVLILEGHPRGLLYEGKNGRFLPGEEKRMALTLTLADERILGGDQTVSLLVRSQLRGSTVASVPLTLHIAEINSFHNELQPANVEGGWWHPQATPMLQVFNNGNQPQKYLVRASDPNGAVEFQWNEEWVSVPANDHQGVSVAMKVVPRQRPLLGGAATFPFNLRVSPNGDLAEEQEVQGQFKVPARIPNMVLLIAPFLLVLCGLLAFFTFNRLQAVQAARSDAEERAVAAQQELARINSDRTAIAEQIAELTDIAQSTDDNEEVLAQISALQDELTNLDEEAAAVEELTTPEPVENVSNGSDTSSEDEESGSSSGGESGGDNSEDVTVSSTPAFLFSTLNLTANEQDGLVSVEVSLDAIPTEEVSISYSTVANTALAGEDFTQTSGTLRWNEGERGPKSINIPIVDDNFNEDTEILQLAFTNPSDGTTDGEQTIVIRITDNDLAPTFTIETTNITVQEGGDGDNNEIKIIVSMNGVNTTDVTATCSVTGGDAVEDTDYEIVEETISWPAATTENEQECLYQTVGDLQDETNKTLTISVRVTVDGTSSPLGNAIVNITDDDELPAVSFVALDNPNESDTTIKVKLKISSPSDQVVSADVSIDAAATTATLGDDYVFTADTVSWPVGSVEDQELDLVINQDVLFEGDERIVLNISNIQNGKSGSPQTLTITILDEEVAGVAVSETTLNLTEITDEDNHQDTYTLTLSSLPLSDDLPPEIQIQTGPDCGLSFTENGVFENSITWNIETALQRTIFVQATPDDFIENPVGLTQVFGDQFNSCTISHLGAGGSGYFDALTNDIAQISVQVADEDAVQLNFIGEVLPLIEDDQETPQPYQIGHTLSLDPDIADQDIDFTLSIEPVLDTEPRKTCLFIQDGDRVTSVIRSFRNSNWQDTQQITVFAVADGIDDDGLDGPLHPPCEIEYAYLGQTAALAPIEMVDQDGSAITITSIDNDDLLILENDTQNVDFELVLDSQPSSAVTITITANPNPIYDGVSTDFVPEDERTECSIKTPNDLKGASKQFVFTPDDHDVSQSFDIRANQDEIDDGPNENDDLNANDYASCFLEVTVTTEDPLYGVDGIAQNVQNMLDDIRVIDNDDPPRIRIVSIDGDNTVGNGVTVNETDTNQRLSAVVSIIGQSIGEIVVGYDLVTTNLGGCAEANNPDDFRDEANTFVWGIADNLDKTADVAVVRGDFEDETDECFKVRFNVVSFPNFQDGDVEFQNASTIVITIEDDDPPPDPY